MFNHASHDRAYALVWNEEQQCYVPAPETSRARGKRSGRALTAMMGLLASAAAHALDPGAHPTGGNVVTGQARITQSGNATTITPAASRVVGFGDVPARQIASALGLVTSAYCAQRPFGRHAECPSWPEAKIADSRAPTGDPMDIGDACKIICQWDNLFVTGKTAPVQPGQLVRAVAELKRYLEERQDGMPIPELAIENHILLTPDGVRKVMQFVGRAETIEYAARRDRGTT